MIQAPCAVPVVVSLQPGAGIFAVQNDTPGGQENQPQMVLPPYSEAVDDLPPPYEAMPTDSQPPAYEGAVRGEWKTYV